MGLPTSDFYSQLKGLEGLSEAERRRLVWKAVVQRGDAIWVIPACVAVGVTLAWLIAGWRLMEIVNVAVNGPAPAAPVVAPGAAPAPSLPTPLKTILFGLGVIVFFGAWVITRRIMVIRTIKRLVNRVVCPACEFCLIGLKPDGPYVTCPECGERVDLYKEGLKPEDLLTERDRRKPFAGAGWYGAYKPPPAEPARSSPPARPTRPSAGEARRR